MRTKKAPQQPPTPQQRTEEATRQIQAILAQHACKLVVGHTVTVETIDP